MKNQFKSLLLVFAIIATLGSVQAQVYMVSMDHEKEEKLLMDFFKAIEAGDFTTLGNLLHKDYEGYGPGNSEIADHATFIENWKNNHNIANDIKITEIVNAALEVKDGDLKGTWVCSWANYSAVQKSDGKKVSFPFQLTSQTRDGKIIGSRLYFNELELMTQLGFKLSPGN